MRRRGGCVIGLASAILIGCGGGGAASPDAGTGGGDPDGAGVDGGVDAGPAAGPDGGLDAGLDAELDAGPDAGATEPDAGACDPCPLSLVLAPSPLEICEGARLPVRVTGAIYSDGTIGPAPAGEVIWTVGFPHFVDADGMVTAGSPFGPAEVTAAIGAVSGSVDLVVKTCDFRLGIEPPVLVMAAGQSAFPRAVLTSLLDGTRTDMTLLVFWTSDSPAAGVIGGTGISACSPGMAVITAWDPVNGFFATAQVYVEDVPAPPGCSGADTTWDGNHSVFTVADVDAIAGCTAITGQLTIQGFDLTDADLAGLASLTSAGSLEVSYTGHLVHLGGLANLAAVNDVVHIDSNGALVDLAGLDHLEVLPGYVYILNNRALVDLTGLGGLTSAGMLLVAHNPLLERLDGLEQLGELGRNLHLADNPALRSLAALENLAVVGESVIVEAGEQLDSLAGLDGLTSVGGLSLQGPGIRDLAPLAGLTSYGSLGLWNTGLTDLDGLPPQAALGALSLGQNPELSSLAALAGLTSIDYGLFISENGVLVDLAGLEGLTRVDGTTSIVSNPLLADVSALAGVTAADPGDTGSFSISFNPSLPACAAEAIAAVWLAAGFDGSITTWFNLGDCP